VCEEVLKVQEFVRVKEAAQTRFDLDAEKRRWRSELECKRAEDAACAVATPADAMELEEEGEGGDGEVASEASSTLSEESCMLDVS
jgi:Fe-S-cluster-containing hydrogenase component 2